jgi:MSHA biogenesis protein MshO
MDRGRSQFVKPVCDIHADVRKLTLTPVAVAPVVSMKQKGFTLIELVMVIVLIGALASVASLFIAQPMEGFLDVNRRVALVDIAQTALQRMTREMRDALPNSVRLTNNGTRFAIEFLSTSTGGRYRASPASVGISDPLDFTANTDSFDILGGLPGSASVDAAGGSGRAACMSNTVDCVVIYNTGTGSTDFNAYTGNNIAAVTAVSNTSLTFNNSDVAGWRFPAASPGGRFFIVDTPVSFVCDSASGEVWMYQNYTISATQPVAAGDFGGIGAVLADQVSDCGAATFQYNAGAGLRYGLVVIRLSISGSGGETVSLLQQVHVMNAP